MRLLQNTKARLVSGVSFGLGGRTLVAGGSGGYDIWDLATSSRIFIPSHNTKYHYGCVCDPRGRCFYVSDSLGGLRILTLDGSGIQRLPGSPYSHHVVSFDLTRDGERLVVSRGGAGSNRVECWKILPSLSFVALWSIRDGQKVAPDEPYLFNQAGWFFNAVALSPDGKKVATSECRNSDRFSAVEDLLVIRNGNNGQIATELGKSATRFKSRMAFAPDEGTLFVWDDRLIERWNVATGRRTGQCPAPGRAYFRGLTIEPFGRFLLTVSGDGQARYWDFATLSPIKALKWPVGKLHSVSISPDGTLAAAGGDKGQVVVWDVDI